MRVLLVFMAVMFAATGAQAQVSLVDANASLGFGFDDETPDSRTVYELEGDLTLAVSPSFDVQLGLGIFGVDDGPGSFGNDAVYYAIHGIYNFSPNSRAGVLVERASSGNNYGYYFYGLEYQHSWASFVIDLQAGVVDAYFNDFNYSSRTFANVNASYEYGDFNFGLGQYYIDDGYDLHGTLLHVGYDINSSGMEAYLEYHAEYRDVFTTPTNTIVVGVSIPIGQNTRTAFDSPASQLLRRLGAP